MKFKDMFTFFEKGERECKNCEKNSYVFMFFFD